MQLTAKKICDSKFPESYSGHYYKGLKQGYGKLTYENGDIYEGEFKNNLWHGPGILTLKDGWVYKCSFINGMKHGKGTYTDLENNTHEVEWVHV